MKRSFCPLVLVAFAVGILPFASGADQGDQKKLQGTWKMTAAWAGGTKVDIPKGADAYYVFAGDKLTMKATGEVDKNGTFKVDPIKRPSQIDLIAEKGKEKETMQGIYKLDGDTLTVAYSAMGPKGKRPAVFEGKDVMVMTFTKEAEKKEKDKDKK